MKNQLNYSQMQHAHVCAIMSELAYTYKAGDTESRHYEEELASFNFSIDGFMDRDGTEFIVASSKNTCIIALRGTTLNINDLIIDLKSQFLIDTPLGRIGYGFRLHSDKVLDDILSIVRHCSKRIVFTGHSLGAAAASDIAMQVKHEHGIDCSVITFGCPRLGDRKLAWNMNRLFPYPWNQRWVNGNDIVTKLPFQFGRFRHSNALQYISTHEKILTSPSCIQVFFDRWRWFKNSPFRWATSQKNDHLLQGYRNIFNEGY